MDATKNHNITPLRWAKAISERHATALKLLTGAEVDAIRDGLKAETELAAVQERIACLAEIRAKLDAKAGA